MRCRRSAANALVRRAALALASTVVIASGSSRADEKPPDSPVFVGSPPPGCRQLGIVKGIRSSDSPTAYEAELEVLKEAKKLGATHLVTLSAWTGRTGAYTQFHSAAAYRCQETVTPPSGTRAGTAEEAKAMLERAVAALRKDEATALEMFQKGEGGFEDRDLYVFCAGPSGNFTAHPTARGASLSTFRDANGDAVGKKVLEVAEEGKFAQVRYLAARPSQTQPVPKVSFVTKIGQQVCGVGYYE